MTKIISGRFVVGKEREPHNSEGLRESYTAKPLETIHIGGETFQKFTTPNVQGHEERSDTVIFGCSVEGCSWTTEGPTAEAYRAYGDHYLRDHEYANDGSERCTVVYLYPEKRT